MTERVVIVGAGQAGGRLAAILRKQGWEGGITLLGDEFDPPYERPPLSKEVLADDADPLVGRLFPDTFYQEQEIALLLARSAASLDPVAKRIQVGHENLDYGTLVLATGARARRLACEGADLPGIFLLRNTEDARGLRPRLQPGAHVVLIGGGFIGLEGAASARKRGCMVTVLEAQPQLLGRVADPAVAEVIQNLHRAKGVEIRCGAQLEAFEGHGRLQAVRLTDGTRIPAEIAVVGIGAVPNQELAVAAGIDCDNGIVVDAATRTSAPDVLAIGDVTAQSHAWLGARVRLESWENAELQAQAAANTILGRPAAAVGAPWFWTDQFDLNLQILGGRCPHDRVVSRGNPADGPWCHFFLKDERIVTACLGNAGRERRAVKQLMDSRAPVEPAALADPGTSLRSLVPKA